MRALPAPHVRRQRVGRYRSGRWVPRLRAERRHRARPLPGGQDPRRPGVRDGRVLDGARQGGLPALAGATDGAGRHAGAAAEGDARTAGGAARMSTKLFKRPTRRVPPEMPSGELTLQEPPVLPEEASGNVALLLTYIPMAMGSSLTMLLFTNSSSMSGTRMWLAGGLMVLTTLSMLFGMVGRNSGTRRRRTKGERRDYLRYLTQTRRKVRQQTLQQQQSLTWPPPDPRGLWSVAMSARLWERRPAHHDFAEVRVGAGEQMFAVKITPLQTKPVEDLEPLSARALRRFIRPPAPRPALPSAVFLGGFARILLHGSPEQTRGLTRALLTQLFTFHSPDDVRIAVCAAPDRAAAWDWLKWLPHAQHPAMVDAAGPVRAVRPTLAEIGMLFGAEFPGRPRHEAGAAPSRDEPFAVVILDGGQVDDENRFLDSGYRNAVLIDVSMTLPWKHSRNVLRLDLTAETLEIVQADRSGNETRTSLGKPDNLSLAHTRACARIVSPHRLNVVNEISEPLVTDFELSTLLGIPDAAEFDPDPLWSAWSAANRLRVPIGVDEAGQPVVLDIKESAQGGMGPHGMLIGATGSGKSELLRTLVLSLAATHSSEVLNFVLVDFKGGATFLN